MVTLARITLEKWRVVRANPNPSKIARHGAVGHLPNMVTTHFLNNILLTLRQMYRPTTPEPALKIMPQRTIDANYMGFQDLNAFNMYSLRSFRFTRWIYRVRVRMAILIQRAFRRFIG